MADHVFPKLIFDVVMEVLVAVPHKTCIQIAVKSAYHSEIFKGAVERCCCVHFESNATIVPLFVQLEWMRSSLMRLNFLKFPHQRQKTLAQCAFINWFSVSIATHNSSSSTVSCSVTESLHSIIGLSSSGSKLMARMMSLLGASSPLELLEDSLS